MKIINFIKKFQKVSFFFGLLLVGLGFLVFTLLPIIMPGSFKTDSGPLSSLIFGAVGVVAIVISVINIKKGLTTSVEEMNYFDKVDKAAVDPEAAEAIRTSTEESEEYYFHFCGKLNQSYILETPDRKPIYEFECDKMGLVNDFVFIFRNHLTGKEEPHNVSHTISTEYSGSGISIVDSSYFKIDDRNIWEYIADMGYSIEPYLESVMWSFHVNHLGVRVADITAAGTNILPEYEGKGGLRDVPMMAGLYRISCRPSDVEAIAVIAFAVSRVQIV